MTELQSRLADYICGYIDRYGELCGDLSSLGTPAALYSERVVMATLIPCTDAILIIYLTEENAKAAGQRPGLHLFDPIGETVSQYLQSGSANCIKVILPPPVAGGSTGPVPLHPPKLPPDLPTERLRGGINLKVLEAHKYGKVNLLGIGISPSLHYEGGVPVATLPTRAHVMSPVISIPPHGNLVLQYVFPFLDVLWGAESLDLSMESGKKWAEADLEVFRLGIQVGLPQRNLVEDPFEAVASHVEAVCDEFQRLVDNPETKEDAVQTFIEKPAHLFVVAPHNKAIYPRRPLGGNRFVPDFTIHRPDGDYHFIEIESPNVPIYQTRGQEPTSNFTHAIQQVEDWLRYVDENLDSVRREDDLPSLYKPTGQVVIGRDRYLRGKAAKRFQFKRAESPRIAFMTYDMLLSQARDYASSLRKMKVSI